MPQEKGLKYDEGKLRWDLLPVAEVEDAATNLIFFIVLNKREPMRIVQQSHDIMRPLLSEVKQEIPIIFNDISF